MKVEDQEDKKGGKVISIGRDICKYQFNDNFLYYL